MTAQNRISWRCYTTCLEYNVDEYLKRRLQYKTIVQLPILQLPIVQLPID